MQTRIHNSAWCVLVSSDMTKVLLTHKVYEDSRNARVLPKWHLDLWEDNQTTPIREVKEETWYVDLEVLTHLWEDSFEYDNDKWHNKKIVNRFLARLISDKKQELWFTEYEKWTFFEQVWCELSDSVSKSTHPWEWQTIQKAIDYLNKKPELD